MTYADRPLFPSRIAGIASSVAIHAAIGLALLLPLKGPGGERTRREGGESVLVVELLPLPPGGSVSRRGMPVERAPDERSGKDTPAGPIARSVHNDMKVALPPPPPGARSDADEPRREATADVRTGASTVTGSELSDFRTRLLRHIERYRHYPDEARRISVEGIAQVHFTMDHAGQVTSIWIETSSGSMLLDDAAVAAVRRATPLPAPPATWPTSVAVTLPIGYSLR